MTTKPRQRGEAGRIDLIKAALVLGGLIASIIGSQILTKQEAATPTATTNQAVFQSVPSAPRQFQMAPVTRSRSS